MKLAKGPRPWSIHLFALIMIATGLAGLIEGLIQLDVSAFAYMLPFLDWNADKVIVFYSARFSIVLIPVVAIWLFASRAARLLVSTFLVVAFSWHGPVLISALNGAVINPLALASAVLQIFAVCLIWMQASKAWFEAKSEVSNEVFM